MGVRFGGSMEHALLLQKIKSIASLARHNGATGERFAEALTQLDDWDLRRINPLRFAKTADLPREVAVDYFVLGVKVGLFDFLWHTICPWCGSVTGECRSFDQLSTEPFFCLFCHAELPRSLDVEIETAFNINPEIKEVRIDPFGNLKDYWRFYFSPNARVPPKLRAYLKEIRRTYVAIQPDQSEIVRCDWNAGDTYRLISLDRHATLFFTVSDGTSACESEVDLLPSGFSSQQICVSPDGEGLRVRNLGDDVTGCILVYNDEDRFHDVLLHNPIRPIPFLTGKMLLNNQTFRDVFRMHSLRSDLKLDIRSVVLLFTDLKGSTRLYDMRGDAAAYELIQEHFRELTEAAYQHHGAIVKTMGDAVMASFSTSRDALAAALEMMQRMHRLNDRQDLSDCSLGLKVGLHQGPTLAVNANDKLDFFGQTVNIAARVQGLAKAGEIWFTEPLRRAAGKVAKGHKIARQKVHLRGLGEDTVVFKLPTC